MRTNSQRKEAKMKQRKESSRQQRKSEIDALKKAFPKYHAGGGVYLLEDGRFIIDDTSWNHRAGDIVVDDVMLDLQGDALFLSRYRYVRLPDTREAAKSAIVRRVSLPEKKWASEVIS